MSAATEVRPTPGSPTGSTGSTAERVTSRDAGASAPPSSPSRVRRTGDVLLRHRLAVVAAVQVLCAIGVVALSRLALVHQSLRLDESQSLQQTDRSYGAMLAQVAQDVHVPGYHLLLRTWRLAFGMDVETARTLSLVFFLACLPVMYLVARRALRTRWALLAVVLFAASPFMNWYANETRMYTMLVLATLVSQHFYLRLLPVGRGAGSGVGRAPVRSAGGWPVWAGYAAAAVVGAYTHYFFLFVLAVQGLYLVAVLLTERSRTRSRRVAQLGRLAGVALLVVVALAPWLAYFRASGAASGTRPNLPSPSSVDLTNVYSQFLGGFLGDGSNSVLVATWPLLMLAALVAVRVAGRPSRQLGYLVAAAFGPVLLAFAASHLLTPFFLSRYMIAALPAVVVLVAAFIGAFRQRVAAVLAVVAVALTVTATAAEVQDPAAPVKEDYRAAAQLVAEKTTARDVVVISSPFTIWPFEHYYEGDAAMTTLPAWDRRAEGGVPTLDVATLPQQVDALAAGHRDVYLVLSYDQGYQDDVSQYFQGHFAKVYEREVSPGLVVVGYRVGYEQLAPVGALQLRETLTTTVGPAQVLPAQP